jgi:hypothetical protein
MKAIEPRTKATDSVIEEVHRHKDAIAQEYGNDIGSYLAALRLRQKHDPRIVKTIKDEQGGGGQPATRPEGT